MQGSPETQMSTRALGEQDLNVAAVPGGNVAPLKGPHAKPRDARCALPRTPTDDMPPLPKTSPVAVRHLHTLPFFPNGYVPSHHPTLCMTTQVSQPNRLGHVAGIAVRQQQEKGQQAARRVTNSSPSTFFTKPVNPTTLASMAVNLLPCP